MFLKEIKGQTVMKAVRPNLQRKYCLLAICYLKIVCSQSEVRHKGMNFIAILSKLYCGLANGVIWNIWENQTVKDICSWFLPAWRESELRMDRDEWENEAISHYYMFWESHMKHSWVKANCPDFKLYLYLGGKTTGSLQYRAKLLTLQ